MLEPRSGKSAQFLQPSPSAQSPAAGSLQAEEMRRENGPCLMLPGLV